MNDYNQRLKKIKEKYVDNATKSENPTFIFIGGQLAAGKNVLSKAISNESQEKQFAIIDFDEYRKYQSDIDEIKKDPVSAVQKTNEFSNNIMTDLLDTSISNKCDILSIWSLRIPELVTDNIKVLKQQNYKIGMCIMAVPYIESLISAQERYEMQIESKKDVPRFVTMEYMTQVDKGFLRYYKTDTAM